MWTGHLNTYPNVEVIYTCLKRGEGTKGKRQNRNPTRDVFCFGGKYVELWHPTRVSLAIRLFRASQWECDRASLSLLPCPPTGTDGHPRSSLISLQSGNDLCSWDVAALFKYDARCSPTFSMSSHCPRKPGEREHTTSHNAACVMGWCDYCLVFILSFLVSASLYVIQRVLLFPPLTHPAERDITRHKVTSSLKSDAILL